MIRCKYCQLHSCTCGREDWEEYMTGGEAKDLLDKAMAENAKLRSALEKIAGIRGRDLSEPWSDAEIAEIAVRETK